MVKTGNIIAFFRPDLSSHFRFNDIDVECDCDRHTYVTDADGKPRKYDVIDGLPRNPCGRTGMRGRGSLYRWGPNHAGDPIVTRWKRDATSNKHVMYLGKKRLEFLAVQRADNGEWAIPGVKMPKTSHPTYVF